MNVLNFKHLNILYSYILYIHMDITYISVNEARFT